jgi:membrane peptidoglycan carboxypeptidase
VRPPAGGRNGGAGYPPNDYPGNGYSANGRSANGRAAGGRSANGYGGDGYGGTTQRPRPGRPDGPGRDDWGDDPRRRGRGNGGRGSGNGGGGRGGPGGTGGRRGFREWLASGDWWRRWTWKKALGVVVGAGLCLFVLVIVGFFVAYSQTNIPTDTTVDASQAPTQVYFANGRSIGEISDGGPNRQVLQSGQIAPVMKQAIIAAEDRNFYSEGGISPTGILRAGYEDLKGGGYDQGGSTLTEELVKNYYTGFETDNSDKSLGDKFKEILVSIKLAHVKSKSWILTQYLNTVYFGQNSDGVGAAAQTYFGVPASQLNTAQAAMLAAMVNQPSYFSPDKSAGQAYTALVARYQYVLGNMVRDNALSQAQATKLDHQFPAVHYHLNNSLSGYRGYLMQMVQQELTTTYGLSQPQLDTGGYKIYTTFSQSLIKGLYKAIAENKAEMRDDGQALPSYAYLGSVLERPSTGAILAVYGGPGYTSNTKLCDQEDCDYNMAENPKQVGSSFKPYVLATAVSQGMDVQDSILNGYSPLWIPENPADRYALSSRTPPAESDGYLPFNEADEDSGALTVAKAAAISSDPAFEDLAHRDGVQNVINMTKAFGVGSTPFTEGGANDYQALNARFGVNSKADTAGSVAIALGEGNLTAVEQASTFATLADDGVYHSPHVVAKIIRNGVMVPLKIQTRPVLTPAQAADVDYALSFDNQDGGTAYPDAAWPGRSVIGKTGTTQTAQDAWFLGAVPQYAMSVALFTYDQNSAGSQTLDVLPDLPGNATGGYGGAWPAKIWDTFMLNEFSDTTPTALPTPDYTGFVQWNQVGGAPASTSPTPAPATTSPAPGTSCTPSPGRACSPGGSATPPVTTPPPTTPPPTPSCTPRIPGGPCTTPSPGAADDDMALTAQSHVQGIAREEESPGALFAKTAIAVLVGFL